MSSGSSALVGSSKRRTLGSMDSARAMATRCFWPPDRRAGYSSRFSTSPTCPGTSPRARWPPPGHAAHLHRGLDAVVEDGHVREQVEVLENHPGPHPDLAHLLLVGRLRGLSGSASTRGRRSRPSRPSAPRGSSRIAAGRLPASGAADEHHRLALRTARSTPAEHMVVAEVFLDPDRWTIGSPSRLVLERVADAAEDDGRLIGHLGPCAARGAPGSS